MPRGVKDRSLAVRRRLILESVYMRALRHKWEPRHMAAVMVASLSPARVRYGVVGPCWYCFDDLASTVDHIVPLTYGGVDDRSNTVSCCWDCNQLKGTMPVDRFLYFYPFGCNEERNATVPRATYPGLAPLVLRPGEREPYKLPRSA